MLQPDNSVPPIDQGMLMLDEPRTKWPTVIGVIGIVLGSLGMICGLVGYLQIPLMRWGYNAQKQAGQVDAVFEAQFAVAQQFQIYMMALLTIGMIFGIWMLAGVIQLVRRRRAARGLLMGWALGSIVLIALNLAFQSLTYQATVQALIDANEVSRMNEIRIGAVFGVCATVVFGMAFQGFTLLWFSRSKIKAEVAQWP